MQVPPRLEPMSNSTDETNEEDYDYDEELATCHTCCGEGWVDSVAEETGRHFWDDDGPGECPNCRGSGLAKDCWYW